MQFFISIRRLPRSPLFPYTTLFRSVLSQRRNFERRSHHTMASGTLGQGCQPERLIENPSGDTGLRSEEHTSELQSHSDLVCRLLLEKKNHQRYASLSKCIHV